MRSPTFGTYLLSFALAGAGVLGGAFAASGVSVPAGSSPSSGAVRVSGSQASPRSRVVASSEDRARTWGRSAVKMPRSRSRIFHVPKRVARMVGNGPRGIRTASARGYSWIDLDANITANGALVIGHWPEIRKDKFVLPGWFTARYGSYPRIADVPWTDLIKLRTRPLRWHGRREVARYYSAVELMRLVAQTRRLGVALEIKRDERFELPKTLRSLVAQREHAGLPASRFMVMTLQTIGDPYARLRAVKAAGIFPAVLLARGRIPQSRRYDFDYVRGPMRWAS
ncbi:MAG: hypothetical protein JWR85_1222 [Marmoricola sp.]|nr:hypothetical protein [Marmoricola sp.]